jgi:hypothetical protein
MGHTCGVTGAYMVIGLSHGAVPGHDNEADRDVRTDLPLPAVDGGPCA